MKSSDRGLFNFVRSMTEHYARMFKLPLKEVRPLPKRKCWFYGQCTKHGVISIRVRNRRRDGTWGGLDRPYQIIDTMAHELAHLIDQKHSNEWFEKHATILYTMAGGATYHKLKQLCKDIKDYERRRCEKN